MTRQRLESYSMEFFERLSSGFRVILELVSSVSRDLCCRGHGRHHGRDQYESIRRRIVARTRVVHEAAWQGDAGQSRTLGWRGRPLGGGRLVDGAAPHFNQVF